MGHKGRHKVYAPRRRRRSLSLSARETLITSKRNRRVIQKASVRGKRRRPSPRSGYNHTSPTILKTIMTTVLPVVLSVLSPVITPSLSPFDQQSIYVMNRQHVGGEKYNTADTVTPAMLKPDTSCSHRNQNLPLEGEGTLRTTEGGLGDNVSVRTDRQQNVDNTRLVQHEGKEDPTPEIPPHLCQSRL